MTKKRASKNVRRASDGVRLYMRSRGVSDDLIDGGLDGAVDRWDVIARSAKDYDFTLDDWLNDMDLRDIIEGALQAAGEAERAEVSRRLANADERLMKATVQTGSIWGDAMTAAASYDPGTTWWYFRRPANPGEIMQADLDAAGLA